MLTHAHVNQGVMNMTKGNPYKLMVKFALPILLSQIFQQLYNTADTFIVGRFLGTSALAAVASSGPLIFLLCSFFIGTAQGAGIVIAKYFGAKEYDKVSRAIHTNVAFGLCAGGLLTIIGMTLTPFFLQWMNTSESILPQAIEYFRFYFAGSLAMVLYNVCSSTMNALGDSKRPLIFLITSSILNVCLDLIFIRVCHFGVWSAAVATVISQFTSLLLCLLHLCRKGNIYTITFKKIHFYKDMLKEILKYGLPGGIQNSVIGFANVIVQSQINVFGAFATAAYGSYAKIEGFAFLPINCFCMAITTFVSQNLGAKEKQRARIGARFGILASVILAELIGVAIYFSAPYLIQLFDSTPEVVANGTMQAHICSLFFGLLALSHAIAAVCRGAGKAFVPMAVMLSVWCVFRICYIITVMHFLHQLQFIFWAYPITWGISSVIYIFYYFFSHWVNGFDKDLGPEKIEATALSVSPEQTAEISQITVTAEEPSIESNELLPALEEENPINE
ncbi:MAG: MATE family efflux transporter [Clostridia bacterium]|nr:MATE family efflux transporter [Clostridia bacterium]